MAADGLSKDLGLNLNLGADVADDAGGEHH